MAEASATTETGSDLPTAWRVRVDWETKIALLLRRDYLRREQQQRRQQQQPQPGNWLNLVSVMKGVKGTPRMGKG